MATKMKAPKRACRQVPPQVIEDAPNGAPRPAATLAPRLLLEDGNYVPKAREEVVHPKSNETRLLSVRHSVDEEADWYGGILTVRGRALDHLDIYIPKATNPYL